MSTYNHGHKPKINWIIIIGYMKLSERKKTIFLKIETFITQSIFHTSFENADIVLVILCCLYKRTYQ